MALSLVQNISGCANFSEQTHRRREQTRAAGLRGALQARRPDRARCVMNSLHTESWESGVSAGLFVPNLRCGEGAPRLRSSDEASSHPRFQELRLEAST